MSPAQPPPAGGLWVMAKRPPQRLFVPPPLPLCSLRPVTPPARRQHGAASSLRHRSSQMGLPVIAPATEQITPLTPLQSYMKGSQLPINGLNNFHTKWFANTPLPLPSHQRRQIPGMDTAGMALANHLAHQGALIVMFSRRKECDVQLHSSVTSRDGISMPFLSCNP